jgi:hypothetical protein
MLPTFKGDMTRLERLLQEARDRNRRTVALARRQGFSFDPILGYVPWDAKGPRFKDSSLEN